MVKRPVRALVMTLLMVGAGFGLISAPAASWSDGNAGGTMAIPEHLRTCAEGFKYCKVKTSGCGGCHGNIDDMAKVQIENEFPVFDRLGVRLVVNGDPTIWEYQPGTTYILDLSIKVKNGFDDPARRDDARPPGFGEYSDGAFSLNASAGTLSVPSEMAGLVRITGGNYTHYGSRNESFAYTPDQTTPDGPQRYGNTPDNETRSAGEATNTYEGSKQRSWRVLWQAPNQPTFPYGVAFMGTVMLPTGEGIDNCVYVQCNQSLGYSEKRYWDWYSTLMEDVTMPSVPRAVIMCEAGAFASRQECFHAVVDHVLPPPPPPDTSGPGTGTDGVASPTPAPSGLAILLVVASAALVLARRRG